MSLKKLLFAITFISIAIFIGITGYLYFIKQSPALAAGNIINATSCEQADVQTAINLAVDGDTVMVPAGNCMWNIGLSITKEIILNGAGIGEAIIKGNVGNNAFVFSYTPAILASNELFRVTGFTFDLNSNSLAFLIDNKSTTHAINKIRIDHNSFVNTTNGPNYVAFNVYGAVGGVFDNNLITGQGYFHIYGINSKAFMDAFTFSYASPDSFYIEDNTVNTDRAFVASQQGGRWVARYNSITYINGDQDLSPWFDTHDNAGTSMSCVYYGNKGTEIYGNSLTLGSIISGVKAFHHRGGKGLFFFNKNVNASNNYFAIKAQEEYSDSYCATTQQPQHVSDSYYWNNRRGAIVASLHVENDTRVPPLEYTISANVDFWNYTTTFDGTVGVGCGTPAFIPATCTIGVAYWATDQSCSSVDSANIGAHPTTPISGTLYKCTTTNTWTSYYTPYTYPHPLAIVPPLKGDFNSDKKVNNLDFTSFKNAFKSIFNSIFDLNSDNTIDVKDLGVLMSGWLE